MTSSTSCAPRGAPPVWPLVRFVPLVLNALPVLPVLLKALLILCAASAAQAMPGPLTQSVTERRIPMKLEAPGSVAHTELFATEYRPAGSGPFPLVLINHGMPRNATERLDVTGRYREQSLEFVRRGFVVINPVRRGYGKTGGAFTEGNVHCADPGYTASGLETARDILAVIDYARTRTDIDSRRILLVGQSAGGYGALAAASLQIEGVRGVISFAGGRGSRGANDVCAEDQLVESLGHYAATTRVPTLWLYAQNDLYFGPDLVRRMVERWRAGGGRVDYRPQPAYADDGHGFFSAPQNIPVWSRALDSFLGLTGLSPGPAVHTAATGGANLR